MIAMMKDVTSNVTESCMRKIITEARPTGGAMTIVSMAGTIVSVNVPTEVTA